MIVGVAGVTMPESVVAEVTRFLVPEVDRAEWRLQRTGVRAGVAQH
jgi:hypothetical protein